MTDADKIYDELSRLTALVNTAVRDHQINMFDRTAVIRLDQFTEMQAAAKRATAIIMQHASR